MKAAIWTLPAERMKAKQAHRIPLSKQSLRLLKKQHGQHKTLVFPSIRDQTELSDMC